MAMLHCSPAAPYWLLLVARATKLKALVDGVLKLRNEVFQTSLLKLRQLPKVKDLLSACTSHIRNLKGAYNRGSRRSFMSCNLMMRPQGTAACNILSSDKIAQKLQMHARTAGDLSEDKI